MPGTPAVSHVRLDRSRRTTAGSICSARTCATAPSSEAGPAIPPQNWSDCQCSAPGPCHVADVDRDGTKDLLVAEMGEFFPADHAKGAVIWMRGLPAAKFGAFWLDGWPRVASVGAADFNGDGKIDLAVAAFGWRKTGQVAILENRTTNVSPAVVHDHTIDPRAGSIQMVPIDLNRDGKMDFVTLLAQQHETVLAYINRRRRLLVRAEGHLRGPAPELGLLRLRVG